MIPSGLANIPQQYLAPGGLLALTFLLVVFGLLVPRTTLRDSQKRESWWRDAFMKERDAHEETRLQLHESLEQGKLTNSILVAVSKPAASVGDH